MKRVALLGILLAVVAAGFGQSLNIPPTRPNSPSQVGLVRGEIESGKYFSSSLLVQLMSNGGLPETAQVNPDGSFELRTATPGMHELIVTGRDGTVLYDEHVNVSLDGQRLSIRIPDTPKAGPAGHDTVSIRQLEHKVPAPAQNAVNKGRSAVAKGNTQEALERFKEAIRIDPEFADAYNDLGAVYASLGELQDAVENFRKAIDLVPDHRMALSNLCVVLGKMQKFDEVGPVARNALRVDPTNTKVHFILAISMIATSENSAEALDHLKRAATEIPMAHVVAAQLLIDSGQRDEARARLEDYLRVAPAEDAHRPAVQEWVRQLQGQ